MLAQSFEVLYGRKSLSLQYSSFSQKYCYADKPMNFYKEILRLFLVDIVSGWLKTQCNFLPKRRQCCVDQQTDCKRFLKRKLMYISVVLVCQLKRLEQFSSFARTLSPRNSPFSFCYSSLVVTMCVPKLDSYIIKIYYDYSPLNSICCYVYILLYFKVMFVQWLIIFNPTVQTYISLKFQRPYSNFQDWIEQFLGNSLKICLIHKEEGLKRVGMQLLIPEGNITSDFFERHVESNHLIAIPVLFRKHSVVWYQLKITLPKVHHFFVLSDKPSLSARSYRLTSVTN